MDLLWYDIRANNQEKLNLIQLPTEPMIKPAYIRWVASDEAGNILVASGDNETAAVWKLDPDEKIWKILLKRGGILEHLQILDSFANQNQLLITSWTEENDWTISRLQFDGNDQLANEFTLIRPSQCVEQPSAAAKLQNGNFVVYDFKLGNLLEFKFSNENVMVADPESTIF